jgi:hypothetical protein
VAITSRATLVGTLSHVGQELRPLRIVPYAHIDQRMRQRHACLRQQRCGLASVSYTDDDLSPFLLKVGLTGSNLRRFFVPTVVQTNEGGISRFFSTACIWDCFKGVVLIYGA